MFVFADSIEDNVETAAGHVEEGREELIKAARYQVRNFQMSSVLCLIVSLQ